MAEAVAGAYRVASVQPVQAAAWLAAGLAVAAAFAAVEQPLVSAVVLGALALVLRTASVSFAVLGVYVLAVFLRLPEAAFSYLGLPGIAHVLTVLVGVAGWARLRREPRPTALPLAAGLVGLVTLVGLTSALIANDAATAQHAVLHQLGDATVAVLIVLLVRTPAALRVALWCLVCGALLVSVLACYQAVTHDFSQEFGGLARPDLTAISGAVVGFRAAGQFGDPNFFAQSLLVALPAALAMAAHAHGMAGRLFAAVAAAFITVAVVLTFSRGGLLVLGLVLVLALWRWHRSLQALAMAAATVVALFAFLPGSYVDRVVSVGSGTTSSVSDASVVERAHGLQTAVRMSVAHPVLGVGLGNYAAHVREFAPSAARTELRRPLPPHNLFLASSAETGLVGLLVLLATVAAALRGPVRLMRLADAWADPELAAHAWAVGTSTLAFFCAAFFLPPAYGRQLWLVVGLALSTYCLLPAGSQVPNLHVVHKTAQEAS